MPAQLPLTAEEQDLYEPGARAGKRSRILAALQLGEAKDPMHGKRGEGGKEHTLLWSVCPVSFSKMQQIFSDTSQSAAWRRWECGDKPSSGR